MVHKYGGILGHISKWNYDWVAHIKRHHLKVVNINYVSTIANQYQPLLSMINYF